MKFIIEKIQIILNNIRNTNNYTNLQYENCEQFLQILNKFYTNNYIF